jgi:hypothetical protein
MCEMILPSWSTDLTQLTSLGGMSGSWKLYTPSILLPNIMCPRHAPAYYRLITQFLTHEQIEEVAAAVDSIGNPPLNAVCYGIEASIGTLRHMAFACLALDSGARSFFEIGSGYGAFANILYRVAAVQGFVIESFTACDIPVAEPVFTNYMNSLGPLPGLSFLPSTLLGADFGGTADMLFSAYALSELNTASRDSFLNNLVDPLTPKCNFIFLVWSSPDDSSVPPGSDVVPEFPSTGRNTNFVTKGFSLTATR